MKTTATTDMNMASAEWNGNGDVRPASAPLSVPRSKKGLARYTGFWTTEQAAHLLRRTMFGPKKEEITLVSQLGVIASVEKVLTINSKVPAPPINLNLDGGVLELGPLPWVISNNNQNDGNRTKALKSWWFNLMMNQGIGITEKMTLFWHNHFVTGTQTVKDARFTYEYINLLRNNGLGNFKTMARKVSTNAAMLVYLNGNQNKKGSPNENYARELMELFTLGRVKLDGTFNYTEDDVVAAARTLTGWVTNSSNYGLPLSPFSSFDTSAHDAGQKKFSAHFNNKVIQRTKASEYNKEVDDLLDMIFDREEVALFICREIYRWFVYYEIDAFAEQNIIVPLANMFRSNGYDIKPVMRTLLSSEHFYDPLVMGCNIKHPIDFVISAVRPTMSYMYPDTVYQFYAGLALQEKAAQMQMDILSPPNVAGWSAYYQAPMFYETWINTTTLQLRRQLAQLLITDGVQLLGEILTTGRNLVQMPLVEFLIYITDGQAQDVNIIIREVVNVMLPRPITSLQRQRLKDVLLPGLPDNEWTIQWLPFFATYKVQPNSSTNIAMMTKIRDFMLEVMTMAEYHLA